jgi:hypothetical protein
MEHVYNLSCLGGRDMTVLQVHPEQKVKRLYLKEQLLWSKAGSGKSETVSEK